MPRYTLLTKSLSGEAIAVREALLSAREPQDLLFRALPEALDLQGVDRDVALVELYFTELKRVLLELQRAYEQLLIDIREQMFDALLLPSDVEAARREVAERCKILDDWVVDLRLKAFVMRLGDTKLPQREWLESVAAGLTDSPPRQWNDGHTRSYKVALAEAAGKFRRVEDIALDKMAVNQEATADRLIRLGFTNAQGYEQRLVVRIAPDQEDEIGDAVDALHKTLQEHISDQRMRVTAVAELARRVMELSRSPGESSD